MNLLGNLIWFIFGGLFGGLCWLFAALLWSITIIGIPVGLQCFKLATMSFYHLVKKLFIIIAVLLFTKILFGCF